MRAEALPVTGAWRPGDPPGRRRFFTFATDRRVRPRERGRADRRHRRLRDVGDARRRRQQRRAAVPRLDGRQPRRRSGRPRPPGARLVGGHGRPWSSDRHRPLVRRVPERPRRVPGHDRPGVAASRRRPAVRVALPGHHDPRHGAGAGPARRPPRHRHVALGDRRLDGRDAGPRVGDHVPPAGCARSCPIATCMQATAQQIAWGAIGRRAIALDPRWRGGDYYDAEPGDGPAEGLAIARMVAQVTFRSDNMFTDRFGRELADRPASGTRSGCGSSSRSSATSNTTAPSSAAASTPTATS